MSRKFTSLIWKYFSVKDEIKDKDFATCEECHKDISRKGGSTSALQNHLKFVHKDIYKQYVEETELKSREKDNNRPQTSLENAKKTYKQMSVTESLERRKCWNNQDPKSQKIDSLICEMLALQDLPFQFVEGLGFKRLVDHLSSQYVLKGRKYYSDFLCTKLYPKILDKVKLLLKDFDKMSFTTDIWSDSSSGVCLLSLTCHGFNKNFIRNSIMLRAELMEERHTGDYISEKFDEMLTYWSIPRNRVHIVVRDGGTNMKRAMSLLNLENIDCAVHSLQLVIKNALKCDDSVVNLLSKCRKIAGHFHHSTAAIDELTKIQERLQQPVLKVIQECVTRWNTTFYMLKRLAEIKDSICLYAANKKIDQLSSDEWTLIDQCVQLLQPFEETTKVLCCPETSISAVIPLMKSIIKILDEEFTSATDVVIKKVISKLKEQLNMRFGNLASNMLYATATYLDPRYKSKFFSEIEIEEIRQTIFHDLEQAQMETNEDTSCLELPKKKQKIDHVVKNKNVSVSIYETMASMLSSSSEDEEAEDEANPAHKLSKLLKEYEQEKRLDTKEDPSTWWAVNTKYQCLAQLARRYLSAPATSVASEQFFSNAGLIYDPLRTRLQGEKAIKLLFLKYNLPLLNFQN